MTLTTITNYVTITPKYMLCSVEEAGSCHVLTDGCKFTHMKLSVLKIGRRFFRQAYSFPRSRLSGVAKGFGHDAIFNDHKTTANLRQSLKKIDNRKK